jgi:hypothetical protein
MGLPNAFTRPAVRTALRGVIPSRRPKHAACATCALLRAAILVHENLPCSLMRKLILVPAQKHKLLLVPLSTQMLSVSLNCSLARTSLGMLVRSTYRARMLARHRRQHRWSTRENKKCDSEPCNNRHAEGVRNHALCLRTNNEAISEAVFILPLAHHCERRQ